MKIYVIFTQIRNNDFRRNHMLIINLIIITKINTISALDQNSNMPSLRNEFLRNFL